MTRQTSFKTFDAQIQPIALYGSEVWGLQCVGVVEKVHTLACKRFLNVQLKTAMCMGILEGTTCLSIRAYELLNTGLDCYIRKKTGCQNEPTTCKLTWN